jgi:hypothetical protein
MSESMSESSLEDLGRHFERMQRGESTNETVVFDPETGEINIRPRGERRSNSDAVVVEQIAQSGFAFSSADCV